MAESTKINPLFTLAAKNAFSRYDTLEEARQKFAEYVRDTGVRSGGPDFFEALLYDVGNPANSVNPGQLREQAKWWCTAKIFAEGPDWLLSPRFSAWWADKKVFAMEAEECFPQIAAKAAEKTAAEKAAKLEADKKALEKVD